MIVTNTPDVLTNATAELALALMLAAARRLGEAERMVRAGEWTGWEPGQLLGRELRGSASASSASGASARAWRSCCAASTSTLLYTARSRASRAERGSALAARAARRAAGASDFVTLHVPLTPRRAT